MPTNPDVDQILSCARYDWNRAHPKGVNVVTQKRAEFDLRAVVVAAIEAAYKQGQEDGPEVVGSPPLAAKIRASLVLDPEATAEVWIREGGAAESDTARAVLLDAADLATVADALDPRGGR